MLVGQAKSLTCQDQSGHNGTRYHPMESVVMNRLTLEAWRCLGSLGLQRDLRPEGPELKWRQWDLREKMIISKII